MSLVPDARISISATIASSQGEVVLFWGSAGDKRYSYYIGGREMAELMLIGGFLGAGKTTLINKLAQVLRGQGKKVGIVTNDQAPALVDTIFLARSNDLVEEVSGSCFCCNYNGFIKAVEKLAAGGADCILAEPVGSCADLSATILQPIKGLEKGKLRLGAFSVLIDPERLEQLMNNEDAGLHPSALYIMRKQLEEADIIVISKEDKFSQEIINTLLERTRKNFPGKEVLAVSGLTGEGIETLLRAIDSVKTPGSHLADMDYDTYAQGEAVLGWLNMETALEKKGEDWSAFARQLLSAIGASFAEEKIAIAHIKLFIEGSKGQIIGNITGGKDSITVSGSLDNQDTVTLVLNARAQTSPENLLARVNAIFAECCLKEGIKHEARTVNCLMPVRPNPTHRYAEVIN